MSRIHYYFDTTTSQYKRIKSRSIDVAINAIAIFFLSTCIALGMTVLLLLRVESPNEVKLKNELAEMKFRFAELDKTANLLESVLTRIEDRDANIYRNVLGAEPPHFSIHEPAKIDYESDFHELDFIASLDSKLNSLKGKLYLESISQDEVIKFTENKELLFASIPAIQPISNKELVAIVSGFGFRIHPIYKVIRMHSGIDFAAPSGTAIYATANGQVIDVEENFIGYGKMVTIDHGFGYITRYAHLQDFLVKVGHKVKRGEQIGFVGNTGLSTSPHLHYEILVNGEQIDPVHYFFSDLSPLEYEKVVELASIQNQSLGN